MFIFAAFVYFTNNINTFEVSQVQYQFLFESMLRKDWILEKYENLHFLTCTQKCQKNSECIGIALGSLKENKSDNKRTCHLLIDIDTSEQYCTHERCDEDLVQVYEVS